MFCYNDKKAASTKNKQNFKKIHMFETKSKLDIKKD